MFVEFERLVISNLLSYGKTPTEFILNSHPTTLFYGESGSGKSAVLNALSFNLFDDTFRNVKKGQLVNSENGKNLMTETYFRVGSDKYCIRRGIKPNILELIKNGNVVNKDAKVSDLQAHIENNVLKFDKKVFNQIISLAEVNFVPFMMLDAKERRNFVEKVLGAEVFSVMNSLIKTRIKDTDAAIEQLQSNLSKIKDKVEIHQKYIEKITRENKDKVAELEAEKKVATKESTKVSKTIETIKEKELKPILKNIPDREIYDEELEDTVSKIAKLEATIKQAKSKVLFLTENEVCPTCERDFQADTKNEDIKKLNDTVLLCEKNLGKGKKLRDSIKTTISEIESKNEEVKKVNKKIQDQEFRLKQYEIEIDSIDKQIAKLKSPVADNTKEIWEEIKKLEQESSSINNKIEELIETKEVQNVCFHSLKDEGIKAEIVRKYIPKINLYINKFLESMGLNVSFYLNSDFEEEIRSRGKEIFTYNSFSGGQRQRINVALLLTWRTIAKVRNSVSTNLLFLDEVLDSNLNIEATEAVMDMFQSDMFKGTNVFVISHKKDIANKFSKVINFELRYDFTKVTQ